MKRLLIILVFAMLFVHGVFAQTPAKLNIKISNFPYLLMETHTLFKSDEEIKVDKIEPGRFLVSYYGKKPRLFYMNLTTILVSPGDSVNLEYNVLNNDQDNFKDTLIASGTNEGNYNFSNFYKVKDRLPKNLYPDYTLPKYQKDIRLLYADLTSNRKAFYEDFATKLNDYHCDKELGAYLLRNKERDLFYDLIYLEDKFDGSPSQKQELGKLIDSVFLNTNFVKSDTAYAYFMELSFKNYLSRIITHQYSDLKTEKNVMDVVNYIEQFPSDFVKAYFVYFLATDYGNVLSKYKLSKLDNLIGSNPYIGRTRGQIMDKKKAYLVN